MKKFALAAVALVLTAGMAAANPCGFDERGRVTVKGYPVGKTAIPEDQVERLEKFAETAKHRFGICIMAQVDKQGTEEANQRVAKGRADQVRKFLVDRGVKPDAIKIALQDEAVTIFGLLPSDQGADRRVVVTHD